MKVGVVLIVFAVLSGCGPQYKIITNYQPPSSASGMACVQQAQNRRQQCNDNCNYRYQQCRNSCQWQYENCRANIAQQAQAEYDRRRHRYHRDYRRYESELPAYEYQQRLLRYLRQQEQQCLDHCNANHHPPVPFEPGPASSGGKFDRGESPRQCRRSCKNHFDSLRPQPLYSKPEPPEEPNYQQILDSFDSDCAAACGCSEQCGCEEHYNNDYRACGGRVIKRQECVANCNQ